MHPGCDKPGPYRAPMARDRLDEYYWFCLDHVREYNKQWDYYRGMETEEIERHLRSDQTWQRPSWPFGLHVAFQDPLGILGGEAKRERQEQKKKPEANSTPEEKALAILDLSRHSSFPEVKARYKELMKKLHPDANGGDKSAEERLKVVNWAYTTLRLAQTP